MPPKEQSYRHNDAIKLLELWGIIWRGKAQIFLVTILFAVLSIHFALQLPNIYRSEALLVPAQEQDSLSTTLQGLSGFAGFAGINLPERSASRSDKALEILRSKRFFADKIYPKIHLFDLMANPRWDPKTNTISYDDNLYDADRGRWVRKVDFPYQIIPTAQEAHIFFIENVLKIASDAKTSFVTISIDHVSPFIARDWAQLMINDVNKEFRERDLEIAISSIDYLNNQIAMTSVVETRQALSELLQNQIESSMLIDANPDYVFSVIDPPIAPELKNRPSRTLFVLLATLLGGMIGVMAVFIIHYVSEGKKI